MEIENLRKKVEILHLKRRLLSSRRIWKIFKEKHFFETQSLQVFKKAEEFKEKHFFESQSLQEKKNLEETREKHSFESQILRNTAIKPEIQYASSSVLTGLDSQSSSDENIPVKKYYYVIYDEPY